MKKINVPLLSEQVLKALKFSGISRRRLTEYRTGFREVISAFGSEPVTHEALDSFIFEKRRLYEEDNYPICKWEISRRCTELLKFFSKNGSIQLPSLPRWDFLHSPLYNKPSDTELDDPRSIIGLLWKVRQALSGTGLAESTLYNYDQGGFSRLYKEYAQSGQAHYSHDLSQKILSKAYAECQSGELSSCIFTRLRKTVFLAENYLLTGEINSNIVPKWQQRELSEHFNVLLGNFSNDIILSGRWSEETLSKSKYLIKKFLFQLEDAGIKAFDNITLQFMSNFMTKFAEQYTGGLSSAIMKIRAFLKYLYTIQTTSLDLSLSIPTLISPRRNYLKGFSPMEMRQLLSIPDVDTSIGKRNYAIMVLAIQTGLRAIDIVNLKRHDIDWSDRKIKITQHKTGKSLCVSLEVETGNAISAYLLNARPKCDLPNVFLSHLGPAKPLCTTALSTFIRKYMNSAGISTANDRRAFHGFRRGFGTRLLEAEIPLELIQQMMGQSRIDSLVPYLSIEEHGLKSCALPLVSASERGHA